jgi:hypothetical protein
MAISPLPGGKFPHGSPHLVALVRAGDVPQRKSALNALIDITPPEPTTDAQSAGSDVA